MPMPSTHWPAPAKINRFLHVTGRRADGYHELQTLFQFVEPTDWLDFELTEGPAIERQGGVLGLAPEADLIVRAAQALKTLASVPQGVRITVNKQIPAGGGLGGGSSDAATTLVALNALWGCQLAQNDLLALGARLGADVPVFISGHAAWAEGIGDQLTPMTPDRPWLLLLNPEETVATENIFCDAKLTRQGVHITMCDFEAELARNDCESVVRERYPKVAQALDRLAEFGPAMLTGTGGCMFARFDNEQTARQALAEWDGPGYGWVCQPKNRSPLLERLAAQEHR
ncbi:MAG: 4-(cytidine 5'-diphospho)-2-C-methyl-D-erythritol kinase [Spiribacter sp.]|jgi:4-diphosphocytidyl-2-C-methyl-D-erythritol kinase|nr:4-(cytidine 5'-diphospho)-2-C-methyl-D-erythritol kinase [Spiribacter sp.]MDR9489508.1 4-(cytidine 5'-diphospho)-2-C-methyl-D-erythritol kinase [Spiribacter sp.]